MKGAYNTKRKKRREKRTPEQVEAEKAAQRTRMRGLRRARKAVELAQAGGFAKTKLWEVPGRDYKLKHFTEDPHQAVLAYYANSGSWRDREARMLMAWVHVRKTLNRELDDAKDAAGVERAERKLHCLSVLNRERLEDRVTLCQVVYEHIDERDWESMLDWQTKNGVNSFERAALEWLVTKGLHCGDDCKLLREKRKRAPIVDAWARSLIGMKLKVPGRWWGNWPSRYAGRKYNCEIVDVDYEVGEAEVEEEDDKRYFVIQCEYDNRRYPMEYKHVREYQRGVEQKEKFDVPVKAYTNPIDDDFEKLCKDALEDLNASNHGSVYEKDYKSIEEEAKRIICPQLVTPEKQQRGSSAFLGDVDDSCDEMDIDELSGAGPGYDSFPKDESETENEDDECEKNIFDEESSDDETVAEPVQFKDSPIAVPLNYVTGEYGQGRLIKTRSPENLHSIPYPVFYRYRGKALRDLNRLEYHSLVQVKRRDKESGEGSERGRAKSKEFPFGRGLEERIGGDGSGRYFQYLRSKQCTPQFFSSPARNPGSKPSDPEQEKAWRMAADKFACDFLIMFRPEPDLYEEGQSCSYEYNWEAFEEFRFDLRTSEYAIDCSRLEQIEKMAHSCGVNEEKKSALTQWRGRRRTIWSAEDKLLARGGVVGERHKTQLGWCKI